MLKQLKKLFNRLFKSKSLHELPKAIDDGKSRPYVSIGDMDGNVKILTQASLDKRTHFKPGDTYQIGEMIITVHANKESMQKAVAAIEARRLAKEAKMRERAIDIMMMSPQELLQFKVDEWSNARKAKNSKIDSIIGKLKGYIGMPIKERVKYESEPPSGIKDLKTSKSKIKDKV